MLESVSLKSLVDRGGLFNNWSWCLTRTWWTREHEIGLALLCRHQMPVEKAADLLARSPTSIAHRARDTGLKLPPEWRSLITPKRLREPPRIQMVYPYISDVRGEHAELLAVNALVPRGLPDHVRGDICQEIMLALWEKTISLDEIKSSPSLVRDFVRRAYKSNYEGSGWAFSLDVPMPDGRSWYEVLPDSATEDF